MILVTGATGMVGRHVVEQLVAMHKEVRATSRDPLRAHLPDGVEVLPVDLTDPASLRPALTGVRRMYLFPQGDPRALLAMAEELEHVVVLSAGAVDLLEDGSGRDNEIAVRHKAVEDAVRDSGVPWTFLRPGMFMANDLRWADSVRAGGLVRAPFAEHAAVPVHERDIAELAVRALLDPVAGTIHRITGEEHLTAAERVAIIGEVLGREVRLEPIPTEVARTQLAEHMPPAMVEAMIQFFDRDGLATRSSPDVRTVTGHAPLTYRQWVADHADAFG